MADNLIELDFHDAPPAQGDEGSDRIPVGRYALRVDRATKRTTTTGKPMITAFFKVAQGEHAGSRLRDQFVIPASPSDNKYGLQRFHALLVAINPQIGQQIAEKKVNFNLDLLKDKLVGADVVDNIIPANGNYSEKTVSQPSIYYPVASLNEKPETTQRSKATAKSQTPTEAAPVPVVATAPAPTVATAATIEESIDSLFE